HLPVGAVQGACAFLSVKFYFIVIRTENHSLFTKIDQYICEFDFINASFSSMVEIIGILKKGQG
ncbi:hypothetical protein ABES03_23625, partial [Neobacillus rhizosphaerae]|uniref:hypothetical protein n=1 Tax=Neobacillus rhizosphaerae TaxID=2880965 RepID=UPI003D2B31AD